MKTSSNQTHTGYELRLLSTRLPEHQKYRYAGNNYIGLVPLHALENLLRFLQLDQSRHCLTQHSCIYDWI